MKYIFILYLFNITDVDIFLYTDFWQIYTYYNHVRWECRGIYFIERFLLGFKLVLDQGMKTSIGF